MRSTPGKRWRHIILNTHCTWLHGDPRGFRNRDHRIHSSGDYKNPPPQGEHAGLHDYHLNRSAQPSWIPPHCFEAVGRAIIDNASKQEHDLVVLSVNPTHVHFLIELPDHVGQIKKIVGWCKFFATRATRERDPSLKDVNLWAEGETYKPVDNDGHFLSVINYILTKQGNDAWTYVHPDYAPPTPTPAESDPTPQGSA